MSRMPCALRLQVNYVSRSRLTKYRQDDVPRVDRSALEVVVKCLRCAVEDAPFVPLTLAS